MDRLMEIARRHGIKVVEDASHAHGATYRGRRIGTIGEIGAFSLQTSKLCPAGEGGILITNEREYYERATALGHYERLGHFDPQGYGRFQHTAFGYKYRISPLHAALARVALAKLDERNRRRNENVRYLMEGLADVPGITPERLPAYVQRVYYGTPRVRYDPAALGGLPVERFAEALRAEGARVSGGTQLRHRGGLHTQPLFTERAHWAFHHPANAASMARVRYGPGTLPVTEHPPHNWVSIPAFPRAGRDLLDQYIAAFHKVAAQAPALLAG